MIPELTKQDILIVSRRLHSMMNLNERVQDLCKRLMIRIILLLRNKFSNLMQLLMQRYLIRRSCFLILIRYRIRYICTMSTRKFTTALSVLDEELMKISEQLTIMKVQPVICKVLSCSKYSSWLESYKLRMSN